MQEHEGHLFPVSFASRKLSEREKNYSTPEKEALAIVSFIKRYNNYLQGSHFILETDHQSLKYMEQNKFINAKIMRWILSLQEYSFRINYIKGSRNYGADYLSRSD